MANIFTLKMWFSFYPGPMQPVFLNIFIVLIALFFMATIITRFYYKKYKKTLYNRVWLSAYNFSLTGLILGLLWLFFVYEQVAFLSSRFWFLIWFLIHAIWLWSIYKKIKQMPEIKQQIKNRKEYQKYIP